MGSCHPHPIPDLPEQPANADTEESAHPPDRRQPIRILMTAVVATLTLATGYAIHAEPASAETQTRHKPGKPPAGNQAQFAGHRTGDQAWQWNWKAWLPEKWQRIGACETGYGQRPGRWDWNSGVYQGAFGFAVSSWDQFKPVAWWPDEAYDASPWQQYRVALEIYKRYGFSGWGCRNA